MGSGDSVVLAELGVNVLPAVIVIGAAILATRDRRRETLWRMCWRGWQLYLRISSRWARRFRSGDYGRQGRAVDAAADRRARCARRGGDAG